MENNFRFEWEKFLNGFDAIEEENSWDKAAYGEMEAYCENILVSVMMHFITVDGIITQTEIDTLNKLFDFNFKFEYIKSIYKSMESEIVKFIKNPEEILAVISAANENICRQYITFLVNACDLIIKSDKRIAPQEAVGIQTFVDALNKLRK